MAKLGFLGLGIMGYPMARNLMQAGHEVALWSHTASKAQELAKTGSGKACATPAEVAAESESVFLCVGDTAMSEKSILDPRASSRAPNPELWLRTQAPFLRQPAAESERSSPKRRFNFSTRPAQAPTGSRRRNADLHDRRGAQVFEKIKPLLEGWGSVFITAEVPAWACTRSSAQNLILSNMLQAFNEGMVLAARAGVDPELMLDILDNSAAKSGLIAYKAPFVFRRDFTTNFSVKWMHKDIGLMLESASEMDVPLPLTSLTQQMFRAAIAKGHGEEDICATIKVLEEITGVEVKKKTAVAASGRPR